MFARAIARTSTRASASLRYTASRSIATSAVRFSDAAVDPKIGGIVDQIEKLTLLEASELVNQLKVRLPT